MAGGEGDEEDGMVGGHHGIAELDTTEQLHWFTGLEGREMGWRDIQVALKVLGRF